MRIVKWKFRDIHTFQPGGGGGVTIVIFIIITLIAMFLTICIDATEENHRGYYKASCTLFNPCNTTRNLTCYLKVKRCLCSPHPHPDFVYEFDKDTKSCVPVRTVDVKPFLDCEDRLDQMAEAQVGQVQDAKVANQSSRLQGLGSCKSHHECQVTRGIPYSTCNLHSCQCECVTHSGSNPVKLTKDGSCMAIHKYEEPCSSDDECDVENHFTCTSNANGIRFCNCTPGYVWSTTKIKCLLPDIVFGWIVPKPPLQLHKEKENEKNETEIMTNHQHQPPTWPPAPAPPAPAFDEHDGISWIVPYVLLPFGVVLSPMIVILLVMLTRLARRRKKRQRQSKNNKNMHKSMNKTLLPVFDSNTKSWVGPRLHEITSSEFIIDRTRELGGGKGGIVYPGDLLFGRAHIPVAIKTVKPTSRFAGTYLESLHLEISIFKLLPDHENVIKVLAYSYATAAVVTPNAGNNSGVGVADALTRNCYLIMELCPLGNLQKFLRQNVYMERRQRYVEHGTEMLEQYTDKDLLQFAYQIATGMEFLSLQRVVHGDLALRNVLLATRYHIKITDFGLARVLDDESPTYIKTTRDPVPWRSSPPEVLIDRQFSTQSDIWSFGVTCWEIFSKGAEPYNGQTYKSSFPRELYSGSHRLSKPELATIEMYRLMKKCWYSEPIQRIRFVELKQQLMQLMNQIIHQRLDDETDDTNIEVDANGYLRQVEPSCP